MLKKLFMSIYFTPLFALVGLGIWYGIFGLIRHFIGPFDLELNGVLEASTYLGYGIAIAILFVYRQDYSHKLFNALCFLWTAAVLHEMGIQHWLTQHDTTALKIRFFTKATNPLSEKIVAGLVILSVLCVVVWLVYKYAWKVIVGFWKLIPYYWTIATFGCLGLITQIMDRFPSHYRKTAGHTLQEFTLFMLKILEEGGESLLPLLFAIALMQYHQHKKIYQIADAPKDIVRDSV